jgi:hypothetical protein
MTSDEDETTTSREGRRTPRVHVRGRMSRTIVRMALVAGFAVAAVAVVSAPASAAPPPLRANSQNRPLLLIHGYAFGTSGFNCASYWGAARTALGDWGWTRSAITTIGYYDANTNCNAMIRDGSGANHEVPIASLGFDLAWWIYNNHSQYGRSVDIIGHSMGGLVARMALTGDQDNWPGWPPYVYVEDVATLGTPHGGLLAAALCPTKQCVDMRTNSELLLRLRQNAQSTSGTDWTLIGADSDEVVSTGSATSSSAGHKLDYDYRSGLNHAGLRSHDLNAINFKLSFWNFYGPGWERHTAGASPLRAARNAVYYWHDW